ncbi:MAG: HAMP domain-containing protein [Gammaproteobacteria bacterium]|nr:HAMP domain-containing protein [Gammaproteobacteria bacterium]MCP5196868.1 HAMP domain-containing protein [Gammaproteobacteria bacterium]
MLTPWPRTTFGRTALVIAGLLVLAELATFMVGRVYLISAGARQMADLLSAHMHTLSATLASLPPDARVSFLAKSPPVGLPLRWDTPPGKLPRLYFFRVLAERLRDRLGARTQIKLDHQSTIVLWIRAPDRTMPWIGMPLDGLEQIAPPLLLAILLSIALLTVAGATLLVQQINRPLLRLATAARQLGKGPSPPLVPEGPEEIQALARAFNYSSASLTRLEQDRNLLLAGVSHDLRTPLARLSIALELLEGDEELKTGASMDIAQIDAILDQFTALARPDWTEPRQTGDLDALIRQVVSTHERDDWSVQLALHPLPPLTFQPLALRRALGNLLENARHYGRPPVTVSSFLERDVVVIQVADCGPGAPEEELERLLLPFTRLDRARSTPGTGLGLAIAERIAAAHGGRIQLRNRAGGGLESRLELPWRSTAMAPSA